MIAAVLLTFLVAQQVPPRDTRPSAIAGTGRISGVVVTDEQQPRPLRRARVTLTPSGNEMPRAAITGDDGSFVFEGVPAGRSALMAAKEAYVPLSYGATRPGRQGTGIQVAAGQTVTITMRLPRGGVITGTVVDVDGRPASGVSVMALSPRVGGGFSDRQWVGPQGVLPATTDDRGVYRIYGLPAGEYIVSAQPIFRSAGIASTSNEVRMMLRGNTVSRPMVLSQVLHPGVSDVTRAARVAVRPGQERGGIDIQLEYVPLATISGSVPSPVGWAPARVTLWRTDEMAQPQSGAVTTADEQGRFTFRSVRPGNYRLAARTTQMPASGGRGSALVGDVQYATADIAISGEDIEGAALSLRPGLSISGQIVFESAQGVTPSLPSELRLPAPVFLAGAGGGWPMPPVTLDGTRFRIDGIVPGSYRVGLLPQGIRAPIGTWWLKSIATGGRDLLDAPLNLEQSIDDAVVTFTDRASEISGTVRGEQGSAITTLWVVAFPVDRSGWFVNSRRIAFVRPNRDGQWSVRNLPPGEYRIAAADLDQGEWFDPAALERLLPAGTAVRVTGAEKYTVDLLIR